MSESNSVGPDVEQKVESDAEQKVEPGAGAVLEAELQMGPARQGEGGKKWRGRVKGAEGGLGGKGSRGGLKWGWR